MAYNDLEKVRADGEQGKSQWEKIESKKAQKNEKKCRLKWYGKG